MHCTSERRLDDGTLEREFIHGEIPGILWTPIPRQHRWSYSATPAGCARCTADWRGEAGTARRTASPPPPSGSPGPLTDPDRPTPSSPGRFAPGAGWRGPVDDEIVD